MSSAPTNDRAAYLDSSDIVKLVIHEHESDGLRAFLGSFHVHVSSILAMVEVIRAASIRGSSAVPQAEPDPSGRSILVLSDEVARRARSLAPTSPRSLDAIHVASALTLDPALSVFVTYDVRLRSAAETIGIDVASPA